MIQEHLALFPVWYAVFLLSLTCHEAAHAWAARRGGDDTAYLAGQVTLNPLPHVLREPFGTVVVPLLSYLQMGGMMGWASAPYDPRWEDLHPRRAAVMALAGPAANAVLAAAAFAALRAGLGAGAFAIPGDPTADRLVEAAPQAAAVMNGVGRMLSIALYLNVLLAVFNLIPFPPMDGASVVAGFVAPLRRVYAGLRGSAFGAIGGILGGILVLRVVFRPVFGAVVTFLFG